MSHRTEHAVRPEISLVIERCHSCNQWYGCESKAEWRCGTCLRKVNDGINAEIDSYKRTISALKGALKRKAAARRS